MRLFWQALEPNLRQQYVVDGVFKRTVHVQHLARLGQWFAPAA